MYTFTLWGGNDPLPEKYQNCVDKLKTIYPDLVVERFEYDAEKYPDIRNQSDALRFQRLAEIAGPALYIDADCEPGAQIFTGDGIENIAFLNCIGGGLDISAIYKPGGFDMTPFLGGRYFDLMRWPNTFNRIQGYPNNLYFIHHWFTSKPTEA